MTAGSSRPGAGGNETALEARAGSGPNGTAVAPRTPALMTQNQILSTAVSDYLSGVDPTNPPKPADVERQLIALTNLTLSDQNMLREPRDRFASLKQLAFSQIAEILLNLHSVVAVSSGESGRKSAKDLLAVYDDARGVYDKDPDAIREVARRYNRELTLSGAREVITVLREWAPRVCESTDSRWIPLANGDFNFKTKVLHPFSTSRVFLNRIPVAYIDNPPLPMLGHDDGTTWDVESWMVELACGSQQLCELLWQVLAACVRAQHPWNKGVGIYSPQGNNGKGTYVDLARNLVGRENDLSASLVELSESSTQEAITGKRLITGDENNVNAFLKYSDVVKKIITGDPLFVNPKYEKPYNYAFRGFILQCLNELLKSGDKSGSFWRRWLLIPFAAQFEGRERKYIKTDYIGRAEVLEYCLHRVLGMDFNEFSETPETLALLAEAKIHNDPVRQFWAEHKDMFGWTLLPLEYLYALYKYWFDEMKPSGKKVDRTSFDDSIRAALAESDDGWVDHGKGMKKKAGDHMRVVECFATAYEAPDKWRRKTFDRAVVFSNVVYHASPSERSTKKAQMAAQSQTVTLEDLADAEAARKVEIDRSARVRFESQQETERVARSVAMLGEAAFYDLPHGQRRAIVGALHQ